MVVVHGIDGSAETSAHIALHLFPKHRALTYDLMGRGSDDSVPPSHALQDYVEQLESQRLPRRFCLVGYSMGGAIAAAYALRHPGRVTSLVLLCPAGRVSNAGRLSASLPFPLWKLLVPRAILSTAAGQYNQRIMRQKRRLYADERFLRVLYGTLREFPLHNLPLGRLSVPTVAIAADSDAIVPPEAVWRLAQECGADFVVVRGTHAAPISSPGAVRRALDEWARSRAGSS